MTFIQTPVSVRTPASSANLGPGFDALGLALSMHDELTGQVVPDGLVVEVTGAGAATVPLDADNLVVRAMFAAFDLLGERPPGLRLSCSNEIPHGRGLGSSAAAIVGGIVLARAMVDGGLDRMDDHAAFQLATDLEGHPDNVAAALFGGLTIAWVDGASAEVQRLDTTVDITVFVPRTAVSTEMARGLLPDVVPHRDASLNAGRAALLVAALTVAPHRLISATEDRLHQSYRAEAMPASYKLLQQLRAEGIPTIISGAGPTVLSFARGIVDRAPEGWAVHELRVDTEGAHVA